MCLEIKNSAVTKSPEIFFGPLKTEEIKKCIFSKKLSFKKSVYNYLKMFKI